MIIAAYLLNCNQKSNVLFFWNNAHGVSRVHTPLTCYAFDIHEPISDSCHARKCKITNYVKWETHFFKVFVRKTLSATFLPKLVNIGRVCQSSSKPNVLSFLSLNKWTQFFRSRKKSFDLFFLSTGLSKTLKRDHFKETKQLTRKQYRHSIAICAPFSIVHRIPPRLCIHIVC